MPLSAPLILLDDNETLFDFSALDSLFEQTFGSAEWKTVWMQATFALALKNTEQGEYHDFPYTGQLALCALAAEREVALPTDFQDRLNAAIGDLPLLPDVKEGVTRLRQAGFRVGVLAMNPAPFVTGQLRHVGLFNDLDVVLSVDNARQLKPGARAYTYALHESGAAASSTWVVSAHPWDVSGAEAAGLRGAYLGRSDAWPSEKRPAPDLSAHTLNELVPLLTRHTPVSV